MMAIKSSDPISNHSVGDIAELVGNRINDYNNWHTRYVLYEELPTLPTRWQRLRRWVWNLVTLQ